MAFVAVQDPENSTTSPIVGIFNMPQKQPVPNGYIGEIADNDPRIIEFNNQQNTGE